MSNWWDEVGQAINGGIGVVGNAVGAAGNALSHWAGDRVTDVGTNFGIHSPGNLRDPLIEGEQALKEGRLDDADAAVKRFGSGNTSEEIQRASDLRAGIQRGYQQRGDQQWDKQVNRLYGDQGLITGLETRRAAQQLASQRILGEMQSKSQLASQSLANKGALDSAYLGSQAALGQAGIGAEAGLRQAGIAAEAGLKNTDLSGLWGFRTSAENNRSAESIADMTSGRNMVTNLEQINAGREANLLANQTQRAGQVLDAYKQNYATTAQALASAANSRSSFQPMGFKY